MYNEYSGKDLDLFFEGYIKSEEDIYYNKDKFDRGEINICFITGLSGSGKSTMARDMSNSNIEHYELDDVLENWHFSYENLKEYGDLIYSFFKGSGKKYKYESFEEFKEKLKGKDESYYEIPLINDFVNYSIKYAKVHKNNKYVIEGVELWVYMNKPEHFKDYTVYIKGTSLVKSKIRASKRDSNDIDNKFKRGKSIVKQLLADNRIYKLGEKRLKEWRNYFKKLMNEQEKTISESFSGKDLDLFFEKALNAKERKELDESDFGLPEQRKYPLIDGEHVKKAIQFFKYCPEKDRKILASNIYKAAKNMMLILMKNR